MPLIRRSGISSRPSTQPTGPTERAQGKDGTVRTDGSVAISVLGEVSATRDGTPVDLGGLKQRAVLALLVLAHGDVVPADGLVDSLWGDSPPRNGTGALHSYLSHLRKRLEPHRDARSREGLIARQGPGYVLKAARRPSTPGGSSGSCSTRPPFPTRPSAPRS